MTRPVSLVGYAGLDSGKCPQSRVARWWVAHLLADTGGVTDLVTLMAAVLHDTIEDTKTTAEELEARFGRTVRKVVEELTGAKSLDKAVCKQQQIDHAPYLSSRAKAIKLADKIANVQDVTDAPPADWDLARRIEYLDWTEKVVAGCRGTNAPLEKLYDEVLKRAALNSEADDVLPTFSPARDASTP